MQVNDVSNTYETCDENVSELQGITKSALRGSRPSGCLTRKQPSCNHVSAILSAVHDISDLKEF